MLTPAAKRVVQSYEYTVDDCPTWRPESVPAVCVECKYGNLAAVRACGVLDCRLWPTRFGTNETRCRP